MDTSDDFVGQSRFKLAREVTDELLSELETQEIAIERSIMKAKRLARLLRDRDAQAWLDYEIKGYPKHFNFETIGSCRKYAIAGGKLDDKENKYWAQSLPELEARMKAEQHALNSMGMPRDFSPGVEDYVASGATINLLNSIWGHIEAQKNSYKQSATLFCSMKSALHAYVIDSYLALQLGDTVESIFETARSNVDTFIRAYVPKAAEQIVSMNERLKENDAESRASALTSCRRLFLSLADAVFPVREVNYIDSKGKSRIVGREQYKNRLLAFLDEKAVGGYQLSILESEIDHFAARLDTVYELSCKGVHANVTIDEARLAVIHTYLFIAEIARLVSQKQESSDSQ
jgi:hypothetical protein